MKSKLTSTLVASLLLFPHFAGCAVFDKLRPAFTSAALTLLVELEDLLRQFESASIPENATSGDQLVFNALQDARYRNLSDLLTLCHGQIPDSTLRGYQARLDVASARAP